MNAYVFAIMKALKTRLPVQEQNKKSGPASNAEAPDNTDNRQSDDQPNRPDPAEKD